MPQKFVNLENLTSFWGNAKEYIGNERKEIEDQLYNWQKTEKAPAVQCEPVPNSELYPMVEFKFKETLPEGEKGSDNPSVITGVNSVTVTRTGKNLCSTDNLSTGMPNLFTFNAATGGIKVSGTTDNRGGAIEFRSVSNSSNAFARGMLQRGKTYTFSHTGNGPTNNFPYFRLFVKNTATSGWGNPRVEISNGSSATYTIPSTAYACLIRIDLNFNETYNCECFVQIEEGSVATSFEPYSGTTAIVNLDGTRYGGTLDLSTGLMTVTHIGIVFNGTESWATKGVIGTTNNTFRHDLTNTTFIALKRPKTNPVCSHYSTLSSINGSRLYISDIFNGTTWFLVVEDTNGVYATNDIWKEFLSTQYSNGTPVTVAYEIETPYVIQLTPQQLKSLSSLEGTSKRINTLYTDVDSIQVEYQKYVGVDSTLNSDSVNAIQNKAVNSALNTKVSLSGDETINGTKTFSNTINGSITGDAGTVAGHIVSKDVPVNAAFTDTTYEPATQSTAGLMSASDKAKLDAVGSVFSFKGSVTDSSSLPVFDNASGDAYLAEDTGHVHVYDGTSFVDIGIWAGIPSATDAQIDALFED